MACPPNSPRSDDLKWCKRLIESGQTRSAVYGGPVARDSAHPLLQDLWAAEDESGRVTVRVGHFSTLCRNLAAIETLARMLANSSSEPDANGHAPLDLWATTSLLGAIESMSTFSRTLAEDALEQAIQPATP
jgi:hypothetical protein